MRILADKGYDSEFSHKIAREIFGLEIDTQIPLRKCERTPKEDEASRGRYTKLMKTDFDKDLYDYRSIIEAINSMIKRKIGDTVYGKSMKSIEKEIKFMCLAHNVRLLIERGLVC